MILKSYPSFPLQTFTYNKTAWNSETCQLNLYRSPNSTLKLSSFPRIDIMVSKEFKVPLKTFAPVRNPNSEASFHSNSSIPLELTLMPCPTTRESMSPTTLKTKNPSLTSKESSQKIIWSSVKPNTEDLKS